MSNLFAGCNSCHWGKYLVEVRKTRSRWGIGWTSLFKCWTEKRVWFCFAKGKSTGTARYLWLLTRLINDALMTNLMSLHMRLTWLIQSQTLLCNFRTVREPQVLSASKWESYVFVSLDKNEKARRVRCGTSGQSSVPPATLCRRHYAARKYENCSPREILIHPHSRWGATAQRIQSAPCSVPDSI